MKIFNTLTGKTQQFSPINKGKVGMYVCGPTVYDFDHLGHARTYIIFDTLVRFLKSLGYQVKYVQNITDVGNLVADQDEGEDKIEKKAKQEGKTPEKIARFYEQEHFADMAALNVQKPDKSPRATGNIADIVRHIQMLIDKGFAYETGGNVYFNVGQFKDYGKLSHKNTAQLLKNVRVKNDPRKKNPADFALWKKAVPAHLQQWDSPWGRGYPGWHIECSVMSTKYLGQPFDIHGSAVEHVFPHHENEIAQSQAAYGKPLANYFVHSGMVTIAGQKMSKSLKNYVLIKDLLKKYPADVIRLALLQTYYRKPFDYNPQVFELAKTRLRKILTARTEAKKIGENEKFRDKFSEELSGDFNTPLALSMIDEYLNKLTVSDFDFISNIFGLRLQPVEIKLTAKQKELIKEREKFRQAGDFKKADEVRTQLAKEGIYIEDTKNGPKGLTKL